MNIYHVTELLFHDKIIYTLTESDFGSLVNFRAYNKRDEAIRECLKLNIANLDLSLDIGYSLLYKGDEVTLSFKNKQLWSLAIGDPQYTLHEVMRVLYETGVKVY